ncbi:MAG: DNA polymerase III subunit delta [Moraxellaceae bacterium]|nr:DNA polymerase III subunit delta [Moraxellaceae bacterium]MDZ4386888.1 DNA polymerase III subunit delta [Moraxellaceae bacterium]
MKLRPEQLPSHLSNTPLRLHVLSGDEPLLIQESLDAIRQQARSSGYDERTQHSVERGFDWDSLIADSQALSLFAERKLLELRFSNKPDAAASAALIELAARPPEDTWLVVCLPKLDGSAQKSKWFNALDAAGAVVTVYPIDAAALPQWLTQRGQRLGLQFEDDALQLLSDRTEGNLLASAQALEKLQLLHNSQPISVALVASLISDSARYSVFDLADAVLLGDAPRAARLIFGLETESTAESVVLWALQKDLRSLIQISENNALNGQRQVSSAQLGQAGFWAKRQGPAQQALKRLNLKRLHQLHTLLLAIDKAIKGQSNERAWDLLLQLAMAMAGKPLFPLAKAEAQ